MTKMIHDSIGIDISKDHLDAHRLSDGAAARFANTPAGFRALSGWLGENLSARVIYEPTGPYHGRFERTFAGCLALVKVNPLQARRFAQACGTRAKTDAVDARLLAQMGEALGLVPDKPTPEYQRALKELQIARTALIKDQTRLRNRLKTQELAFTRRQTKLRLGQVARQLAALNTEIETRLSETGETTRALEILRSIPGIGQIAAAAILIECPEIGTMQRKQAASLAGLAPMTRQSGKWRGYAFIQGGRKHLRDALYMPALVAARFNPDLSTKYQAMIKSGKPAKVALTCLMRKLIELANALIKADRKWQPKPA
jgi:transposase